MGNNSVPKLIFRLSRFPVYRGSVLGRFYCITNLYANTSVTIVMFCYLMSFSFIISSVCIFVYGLLLEVFSVMFLSCRTKPDLMAVVSAH